MVLERMRAAVPTVITDVVGVSVVTLILLGVVVANVG
jgi:hypothetical protein